MLSEENLISGEAQASDDIGGMDILIQNMYNEVMKRRAKIFRMIADRKSEEAIQLQETADQMASELDRMIKQHTNYKKFLDSISKGQKGTGGKLVGMPPATSIKNQKSSNGNIVSEIPKS